MTVESAPRPCTDKREDFLRALGRTHTALQDGLERLEMARSDARGENQSLDAVDVSLHPGSSNVEEAGAARARKIAASVAEDLEAAADRLRRAAQS
jgi:hypothetical protein